MDKDKVTYWLDRYNKEEDAYNTGLEEELGSKIRKDGFLSKEDLIKIVDWKFAKNLHRKKRTLNLLETVSDSEIINRTREALKEKEIQDKLKELMNIKGVGLALASTILTFRDPQEFFVFDIHIFDEIYHTDGKTRPANKSQDINSYIDILSHLKEIAIKSDLSVREAEKALFKKNLEEAKSTN